jgi:hypothetical protein
MHSEPQNSPLENIRFTDRLPVAWSTLAALPSEGEQHRDQRANEELLQSLLLRDGVPQDAEEADAAGEHEHFKRLEARLDLLLSLVMEMMTSNGKLPSSYEVMLSARGLCVQIPSGVGNDGLKKDALLKIQLFLDPRFPRPLTLGAQVVDVQPQNFTVSFSPLEECLQDLLDKYVFRQHRRAIALARRSEIS